MIRDVFEFFAHAFWGGVAVLVGLAVIVFVLRQAKNRIPVTAPVANTASNLTGLNI